MSNISTPINTSVHLPTPFQICIDWASKKFPTHASLIGRVTTEWRSSFLICTTAFAIIKVIVSLFSGAFFSAFTFALLGTASYYGYTYAQNYFSFAGLDKQVEKLQTANQNLEKVQTELEKVKDNLEQENATFKESNFALKQHNEKLQKMTQTLQEQIASLHLSLTQLRSSSEIMRGEVERFVHANGHLAVHVSGLSSILKKLDDELLLSKSLSAQVQSQLSQQNADFANKLAELNLMLSDLKAENKVLEKMQVLLVLQQQILSATGELKTLQSNYSLERGRLEDVRKALEKERAQFEVLRATFSSVFSDKLKDLTEERAKLQELFERISTAFSRSHIIT